MFEWLFTAEDAPHDTISGEKFRTEAQAVRAGKKWARENNRKGKITAVEAESERSWSCIADW